MQSKIFVLVLFVLIVNTVSAQKKAINIYNPKADAGNDIKLAVQQAKKANKHILIQVGGNWCPWCVKLHKFCNETTKIDSIIKADYVVIKLNHSKENKNLDVLKDLGYPQRFGFPVLVILDDKGNRLHTQNSVYLEESKGYSEKRVFDFLKYWNQAALSPENYK